MTAAFRMESPEAPATEPGRRMVDHAALPDPLDRRLIVLGDPLSGSARGYRLLRHRLLTAGDPRVITVTSALPGEGKTTCAVNLALCLAEDSAGNVLLLDANPRRPALAALFGLGVPGGEPAARHGQAPYPAITAIGSTRLHVASAQGGSPTGAGRLERAGFAQLVGALRADYDYIVADAASVLDSADADVVSELSDGVVVAARCRRSRRGVVSRAIDELHPARVLGVVLIDA